MIEEYDCIILEDNDDSREQFDEYTLNEIENDRQLDVILNFKNAISKEPEFYGVFRMSAYRILQIFENSTHTIVKIGILTEEQLKIFKSVYYEIYNTLPDDTKIHKIAFNLYKKIYIN